jgi:hypothetical protein
LVEIGLVVKFTQMMLSVGEQKGSQENLTQVSYKGIAMKKVTVNALYM